MSNIIRLPKRESPNYFKLGDRVRVYVRDNLHCSTNGRYGTVVFVPHGGLQRIGVKLDNDHAPQRSYLSHHLEPAPSEAS